MVEVCEIFNPVSKSETTNVLVFVSQIREVEGSCLTMKNSIAKKAPLAEWLETSADQTGITQSIAPTPIPAITRANFQSQRGFFQAKARALRQHEDVSRAFCSRFMSHNLNIGLELFRNNTYRNTSMRYFVQKPVVSHPVEPT